MKLKINSIGNLAMLGCAMLAVSFMEPAVAGSKPPPPKPPQQKKQLNDSTTNDRLESEIQSLQGKISKLKTDDMEMSPSLKMTDDARNDLIKDLSDGLKSLQSDIAAAQKNKQLTAEHVKQLNNQIPEVKKFLQEIASRQLTNEMKKLQDEMAALQKGDAEQDPAAKPTVEARNALIKDLGDGLKKTQTDLSDAEKGGNLPADTQRDFQTGTDLKGSRDLHQQLQQIQQFLTQIPKSAAAPPVAKASPASTPNGSPAAGGQTSTDAGH